MHHLHLHDPISKDRRSLEIEKGYSVSLLLGETNVLAHALCHLGTFSHFPTPLYAIGVEGQATMTPVELDEISFIGLYACFMITYTIAPVFICPHFSL